ncbi:acyl-CoA synthetase domain protein [Mycobacterium xenopi 4042]|uniref:Acyl-CoA synthetase domain protein n=1 Tax=Mycobacterium xenopi 4042 TaxID=1299334 RepID=X8DDI1_MYCXE|nr:acyl-CoA synthetase domain protein [Mycobacterium xenopi 4042]
MARTGFQLLDPLKTAKARIDFLRQLHDREALLPREPQRRFLESEGWIAWSGPAVSELLKQFIAHNRMMTGGFAINGQLVTLTDITCPVLAFVGEVDDIGQPRPYEASGARHPTPTYTNTLCAQGISASSSGRKRRSKPGRPSRPGCCGSLGPGTSRPTSRRWSSGRSSQPNLASR